MPALAQAGKHASGALRGVGVHLLQQREELLMVDEDGELLLQLFLFTGLRVKGLDLGDRVGEKVDPPQPLALVAHELGQALAQGRQGCVQRVEALGELFGARPAVHQPAVVLQVQQRLVLMLAVQVEEESGELVKVGARDRCGLDEERASPVGFQHPAEDDGALLSLDPVRGKPLRRLRVPRTDTMPETVVSSAPERMMEVSVLSPRRRPSAPTRIDLPAPVSPLRMFRPLVKRTCSLSMMA